MMIFTGGNLIITNFIVSVFIGPVIEEAAKNLSIRTGNSGTHFVVFNIFEFVYNILRGQGIIERAIVVMMHFFSTVLQKLGYKQEKKNNKKEAWIFYLTALFNHNAKNLIAFLITSEETLK